MDTARTGGPDTARSYGSARSGGQTARSAFAPSQYSYRSRGSAGGVSHSPCPLRCIRCSSCRCLKGIDPTARASDTLTLRMFLPTPLQRLACNGSTLMGMANQQQSHVSLPVGLITLTTFPTACRRMILIPRRRPARRVSASG